MFISRKNIKIIFITKINKYDKEGYDSIQVGYVEKSEKNLNKSDKSALQDNNCYVCQDDLAKLHETTDIVLQADSPGALKRFKINGCFNCFKTWLGHGNNTNLTGENLPRDVTFKVARAKNNRL